MQYLKIMKYARRGESAFVRLSQIFKDYSYLSGRKILAANQVSLLRCHEASASAGFIASHEILPTCMFWQVGGVSRIPESKKGLYATFSSWHIDPCRFPVIFLRLARNPKVICITYCIASPIRAATIIHRERSYRLFSHLTYR